MPPFHLPHRIRTRLLLGACAAFCLTARPALIVQSASEESAFRMPAPAFQTDVPDSAFDILLARPTATRVTASVLFFSDGEAVMEFKSDAAATWSRTETWPLNSGVPREIVLDGLTPNASHRYRLLTRQRDAEDFTVRAEHSFHTARPPGSPFTFTVTADTHLDFGISLERHRQSLSNVLSNQPDFHIDLGDTFMTDKRDHYTDAAPQYAAQRYWFGLIGHSVPVFLTLGNHDGEGPSRDAGGWPDAMARWSHAQRTRLFPNPIPDSFYLGDGETHPAVGHPQSTFAWHWGDALFVVLDPFRHSTRGRRGESSGWGRSLGGTQYEWFRKLLASHPAPLTFVCLHHLVGGEPKDARGGVEASHLFEWGGHDPDGSRTFSQHRPDWEAPIHELLRRRAGKVHVLHGHDHFFARQERDGIVYHLVPQPGHRRGANGNAAEYGYRSGQILPGSGILRVRVEDRTARIDFVKVP